MPIPALTKDSFEESEEMALQREENKRELRVQEILLSLPSKGYKSFTAEDKDSLLEAIATKLGLLHSD